MDCNKYNEQFCLSDECGSKHSYPCRGRILPKTKPYPIDMVSIIM